MKEWQVTSTKSSRNSKSEGSEIYISQKIHMYLSTK